MFTTEHGFDATIITLIDEPPAPLGEDVIIRLTQDAAIIRQYDAALEAYREIRLSASQLRDVIAAFNLPEGIYRVE